MVKGFLAVCAYNKTGCIMELVRENIDGTAVISFQSERLDAVIAVRFKDQFRDLTDETTSRYILDLSGVDFMDSSGLGAVVAVYKFLGRERLLDLAGLSPPVDRVFRLTRMDSVFTIYENVEKALGNGDPTVLVQTAG